MITTIVYETIHYHVIKTYILDESRDAILVSNSFGDIVNILVGDLETDGLSPNRIWVVGVLDYITDEFRAYTGEDVAEGLMRLADADLVIGHNFIDYDAAVAEKLTDGLITFDRERIADTLKMGRRLLPQMSPQKLENWGDLFGYPKIQFNEGFDRYRPNMVPYCHRDCEIAKLAFDFMMELESQAAITA